VFILQGSALGDLGVVVDFRVHLVEVDLCLQSATVKELLKLESICQSYAQMKKGPVFFWLTVYIGNS